MLTHFLPKLLAKITGKPRYLPKIVWSDKSFVHNFFRVYETIFWRRYGIRPESFTSIDQNGKVHREFYSVEAVLAHIETMIRNGFYIPDSIKIFVPRISTPEGFHFTNGISFAIAIDTSTYNGPLEASPSTYTHTCTGSDLLLLAVTYQAVATDNVTAHTYNGDALTKIDFQPPDAGINYYSQGLWYRASPDTGANSVSITTSSGNVSGACVSYTGCRQTSIPDSSAKGATTSVTTITGTTTVVTDDSWLFMCVSESGGNPTAGTSTTLRLSTFGGTALFDSNGTVASGSRSLIANWSGSGNVGYQIISFAPATANITLNPSAQSLALTLNAPTVAIDDSFSASAQSLSLTLETPTVIAGTSVLPSAQSLALTLNAPTLSLDWTVAVSDLSITSSVLSPSLVLGITIFPEAFDLTLTINQIGNRWNPRIPISSSWTNRTAVSTSWTPRTPL